MTALHKSFSIFPALALFLCTAVISVADAAELTIEPEQQLKFAEQLLESRQYRRAAEEFERFAFFFPDHADQRYALLHAGRAYLLSRNAQAAQIQFKSLIAGDRLDLHAVEAHFLLAESYLQMGVRTHAIVRLNNLIAITDDPDIEDRAYHRMGWMGIEATDWQGAQRAFDRISPEGKKRYGIEKLTASLNRSEEIPQKKPYLAGTLSIIPGGGQLYCRRYKDAAVAFVLNVGTFWAASEAFDEDLNALGGLLALIGVGFYSGNIYGAVNDARKFNAQQKRLFIDDLQQNHRLRSEIWPMDTDHGLLLGVRFSF